jgi:hypothetical protein
MVKNHLAIFREPWYGDILEGKKHIESRWSICERTPYGDVSPKDWIYLKPVWDCFVNYRVKVDWVEYHHGILATRKEMLKHKDQIRVDEKYILSKPKCQYLTLIGLADLEELDPISFTQTGQRAWITNYNPRRNQY